MSDAVNANSSDGELLPSAGLDDDGDAGNNDVDESQYLVDIQSDVHEIDLTHCRLRNLQALGWDRFSRLSNLFHKINGLGVLAATLTDLDLYDNRLSKFDSLAALIKLENLDLSFNRIKAILPNVFEHLVHLKELFLVANKISIIENLNGLVELRNLELGANRIRVIENIGHLAALEQLWLGKNKIKQLSGFTGLHSLSILSMQSNRITAIENLESLVNLEELYLSHNGINTLGGLEHNLNLRVLDVGNNRIKCLEGIKHLVKLEEFWASYNQISSWEEIEYQTSTLTSLETIYLESNPVQKEHMATYRTKLQLMIPSIRQIDATYVRN